MGEVGNSFWYLFAVLKSEAVWIYWIRWSKRSPQKHGWRIQQQENGNLSTNGCNVLGRYHHCRSNTCIEAGVLHRSYREIQCGGLLDLAISARASHPRPSPDTPKLGASLNSYNKLTEKKQIFLSPENFSSCSPSSSPLHLSQKFTQG